jgi:hypothetical protein
MLDSMHTLALLLSRSYHSAIIDLCTHHSQGAVRLGELKGSVCHSRHAGLALLTLLRTALLISFPSLPRLNRHIYLMWILLKGTDKAQTESRRVDPEVKGT